MSARTITLLGATGSVGRATLDLIARAGDGAYDVVALTANGNAAELAKLARQFGAKFCAVADESAGPALGEALAGSGIKWGAGPQAVEDAAAMDADWVMAAIVGAAGLQPTLAAVRRGACVAFANKEALVCAGVLMLDEAARSGATLLPVDSEHNAIFQAFDPDQRSHIRRIILTASGGPFHTASLETMRAAGPRRGGGPSHLDHGRENLGRQRHHDEQGAGDHRGLPSLRPAAGAGGCAGSS